MTFRITFDWSIIAIAAANGFKRVLNANLLIKKSFNDVCLRVKPLIKVFSFFAHWPIIIIRLAAARGGIIFLSDVCVVCFADVADLNVSKNRITS